MIAPILGCLFACGAAPVAVSVEAHGKSAPAPGAQVVLVPADPRIPPTDPVYVYLTKVVSRALSQKGLRPTTTVAEGDAVVSIGWLQDAPKVITRTLSTMGSGNFGEVPRSQSGGVRGLAGEPSLADLSTGIDPAEPKVQKITRYPWTIELKGLDTTGPTPVVLWVVTARADSASDDAADIAPELIAASAPFIGTDNSRKDIKISAGDAAVKSLLVDMTKAGPEQPSTTKR